MWRPQPLMDRLRMSRQRVHLGLSVVALALACRRGPSPDASSRASQLDASAPPTGALASVLDKRWGSTDPVFSAPIAAARVGDAIFVAGYVAANHAVRVVAFRGARLTSTTDAIVGAVLSANAELSLRAVGDGAALFWRDGAAVSRGAGTFRLLGANGELRGPSIDVGSALCSTAQGVVWVETAARGADRHVFAQTYAETRARSVATVPSDRAPTLVCGKHHVFLLGDGDDDLTVTAFAPEDVLAPPARTVLTTQDFADEERDHQAYAFGDVLALLRVGGNGGLSIRNVSAEGVASPWRRLKQALPADDDIVAVSGDGTHTVIVFTHDVDEDCASTGASAQRVRVLEDDRDAQKEVLRDLALPDCERSPGPFWINLPSAGPPRVAWVERRGGTSSSNAPPVVGLAYRVVQADSPLVRRDVEGESLVDAGCDEVRCYGALLARSSGEAPSPLPVVVVAYP